MEIKFFNSADMDTRDIFLYIVLPSIIGILVLICLLLGLYKLHRNWNRFSYDKVNHELDDEEIEFKSMLEKKSNDKLVSKIVQFMNNKNKNSASSSKSNNISSNNGSDNINYNQIGDDSMDDDFDIDGLNDDSIFNSEDLESVMFDKKDKESLHMLNKLRDNLIQTIHTDNVDDDEDNKNDADDHEDGVDHHHHINQLSV